MVIKKSALPCIEAFFWRDSMREEGGEGREDAVRRVT